jgi:hypothetical protein
MKSHLTGARSARPATMFSLLAAVTAAVIALLPHVLATAAPATERTAASSYGIWSDSTVPAVPTSDETRSVTLGLVFSSATAGRLRAVQYYGAGANRVATTGDVWNGAGRRIASVRFPATATDGWKTASLSSPVRIRAGQKYTVSYRAPRGRNAVETGVFDDGGTLSARELTAHRGTFGYGTGRPTQATSGAHYFIDVLFAPSSTTSVPAPSPDPTTTATPSPDPTTTATPSPEPTTTATPSPEPTTTATPSPEPTTTATPTPTPAPSSGACVKPDVTNTGPSGTLTAYSGSSYVSTAGTVIENRTINGNLTIAADNVILRNSVVTGALGVTERSGVRISNVTMREFSISSAVDVVLDRSEITGSIADGMHVTSDGNQMNRDIVITNNLIHNPKPGAGSHYDGLQVRGVDGLDLLCNNFDLGPAQFEYNAALYLEPANGGHSGVVVDNNWLSGGGYIFHYGADNDGATRLTNNHFGGDPYWGPSAVCHTSGAVPAVQTGNDLRGAAFTPCPR